jgi:hypothetical protein
MKRSALRIAAVIGVASALLAAGCGGGGGDPGACLSGSPEVCAAGGNHNFPAPAPVSPQPSQR